MALQPSTRDQLLKVSTATLCTALFKRGLRNQFIQDVRPLNDQLPNMVGEASPTMLGSWSLSGRTS